MLEVVYSSHSPGLSSFTSPQRENKHLVACKLLGILMPYNLRLQQILEFFWGLLIHGC